MDPVPAPVPTNGNPQSAAVAANQPSANAPHADHHLTSPDQPLDSRPDAAVDDPHLHHVAESKEIAAANTSRSTSADGVHQSPAALNGNVSEKHDDQPLQQTPSGMQGGVPVVKPVPAAEKMSKAVVALVMLALCVC